ncbi:MAG: gfo/Idh/MocA family oxidoreductase, partial [Ruminococcaceae bacterium]|nr:gfo/Idh/MocA family oxidoreductase [Oscillospiraceae bacterium]
MEKLRLGILGTGKRGKSVTLECLVPRENVEITALCDVYEDKMQAVADEIVKAGK